MSERIAPPAIVVRDVEKAYEGGRIRALNGMTNNTLKVGQVLKIP